MTRLALLSSEDHGNLRVITERSAIFGDNVMSSDVFTFEFRRLQGNYPLVFQKDAAGNLFPRALFGFEEGENLYLDKSGWRAGYVPAIIRREPFLIGFQKTPEESEDKRLLSIDLDHPRVSTTEGEQLFQPLGGNTPFLDETAALLETIYKGIEHTRAFMQALQEHQLTEIINFEVVMQDGSKNQLLGYHGINEQQLRQLKGPVLEDFSEKGFLAPMFMIIASLSSIGRLIDLKNARMKQSAE